MKRVYACFALGFLACLLATANVVHAGGFALYEWGNRALGMGTANYATGNDASVVAYNPAQMSRLEGTNIYGGVTAVSPSSDVYINGDKNRTQKEVFGVPHAFATHQLNEDWTLGLGLYTRFGLGTNYDSDWPGDTLIEDALLESFSMTPTVSYKINDSLSVGGGIEIIKGFFTVHRELPTFGGGTLKTDVEGTSFGFNMGLLYDFNEMFSLGLMYRSPVHFEGDGDVEVTRSPLPINGKGDCTMTADFPASYSVGLGFKPIENLTFEFDIVYTQWEQFDRIEFDFDGSALPDTVEDFNYKSTWRFQLGAEYLLTDAFALRAGYVYDQTPIRGEYASPMLPANDRQMFTLGAGYKWSDWTVDVAGMYIITKERTGITMSDGAQNYDVDFKNGSTWGVGTSIGYHF
ncbi:OmpP1/FadL family transporter [Pseudodesulfovibrio thermohalotolerans]|uniref:OmpP1/FadL family transporter n=1 Tax=Pseudodesulfovibrio thermohalotolerans TaxID=2880651 RepID=UPI00244163D6|nr:OmpP1/FadL family transporter [Pseudodesulfovibrio thermohalotolerans]WFS61357.1 OmpP1/FadL family transporter [Pseudodesulfovibrio thermohalotolerans]